MLFSNSTVSKTDFSEENFQAKNQIRKASGQNTPDYAELSTLEVTSSTASIDEQESNDTFETANIISEAPTGKPINYVVSRRGTLYQKTFLGFQTGIDEDYYRFDVYGKGSAIVSLTNIPENTCYDLAVYSFPNEKYATFSSINNPDTDFKNGNTDETILKNVVPGTYYAKVFSHNAQTYDNTNKYTLTVSVTYSNENKSISDLRYNKGASAAIWVSDYSPCGFYPFKSLVREQIDNFPTTNPFVKAMIEKTGGLPIRQSTIYLWDPLWRREIRNELRDVIIPALQASVSRYEKAKVQAERFENGLGFFLDILGFVPGVGTVAGIVSLTIDACDYYGLSLLPVLFPSCDDIDSQSLLDYSINLETAVDIDGNTSTSEVIKIPSFYKMYQATPNGNWLEFKQTFADFSPIYDNFGYLYSEDTITSYQTDSFVNGTINLLKTGTDIANLFSGTYTYNCADVNTASPKTIVADSPDIRQGLNTGEYLWYTFTAPDNAYYRCYTEGNGYLSLECFSQAVPGRSISGKLSDEYVAYDGHNAQISRKMYKNDVVFIRLRGTGWGAEPAFSFRVSKGETFHVHDYTDHYVYWNNSYHKAYCACGECRLARHGVDSSTTKVINGVTMARCVDCGHWIDISGGAIVADEITIPQIEYTYSTKDSVLVLSTQDVKEYALGYFTL